MFCNKKYITFSIKYYKIFLYIKFFKNIPPHKISTTQPHKHLKKIKLILSQILKSKNTLNFTIFITITLTYT